MNKKIIKCNHVKYRQGFIEVAEKIHEGSINIEVWNVTPDIDISSIGSVTDNLLSDESIVSNTEIELSVKNAESLIQKLSEAIEKTR